MKEKECEHLHLLEEVDAYKKLTFNKKKNTYIIGELIEYSSTGFYWCNDCKRHLTESEISKMNL